MVSLCIRSFSTVCKLPRTYSESGRCSARYFACYYTSFNQNHLNKYCVFPPRTIQRSAAGDNYAHARTVDTFSPPKSLGASLRYRANASINAAKPYPHTSSWISSRQKSMTSLGMRHGESPFSEALSERSRSSLSESITIK